MILYRFGIGANVRGRREKIGADNPQGFLISRFLDVLKVEVWHACLIGALLAVAGFVTVLGFDVIRRISIERHLHLMGWLESHNVGERISFFSFDGH